MYVIATAGHVDHGKSTLVRALTGMEPDRWAEERRRGMTIDLGYAWTRLDSGEDVAFVDVPGHERFATNMLAGVGPVPAVMLVIAADEGWSAQTEEHVRALDALGVRHGLLAVTRSDLADPSPAIAQASEHLAATTLAALPAVAVSGATGKGLEALRCELGSLVARLAEPDPDARVRLWLDRCFTIRGSGTVVTGTLGAGRIRRGDTLELNGHPVSVRALQSLGVSAEEARGTARIALNLRGVPSHAVHRGDCLLTPGAWHVTDVVDVRAGAATLPTRLVVHIGSAAVPARVRALPGEPDATSRVHRLRLDGRLPLQRGDRLLLRDAGRRLVLGGATVLDPAPPELRRRGDARRRAAQLRGDDGGGDLRAELARRGAAPIGFLQAIGVDLPDPLPESAVRAGGWLVDRATWQAWGSRLTELVDAAAAQARLAAGVQVAELAASVGLPDPQLLRPLLAASTALEELNGRVRRRGAGNHLRPDIESAVEHLAACLSESPFAAPDQAALTALGLGHKDLQAAAAARALLVLPGDVVLLPTAATEAEERLRLLPQPFTLSAARQALGTTRRVAVPLLEHLDSLHVTQRVDSERRRVRTA